VLITGFRPTTGRFVAAAPVELRQAFDGSAIDAVTGSSFFVL